jgi:hypothetical protein
MTENINSEALDKLFEIDGELYGAPSLVRMARIRASILHASSAWGSSDDGALIGALADEVERLREALAELADLMDDVCDGKYQPDSFTTQPARAALGDTE